MLARAVGAVLIAFVAACSAGPEPTPTNPPTQSPGVTGSQTTGVAGVLEALGGAGAGVREADTFMADPLASQGVLICVDKEPISVYVFASPEDALARSRLIDPRDPSHVGTAIIEWVGEPKFWLHDRLIVLYQGTDAEVEQRLVDVLGQPFAFGQGRGFLPGAPDPC